MRTIMKRLVFSAVIFMTAILVFPVLGFAEEAGGSGGGSGGIGMLIPDLGELIPMLVGFIILWLVLAKTAWPMFMGMIDKRAEIIKDSLERAESANIESERILAANKTQLDEAKKQAAQIIDDAKTTGDAIRTEIMEQAQEDARLLIEKANTAIEREKKAAIAQLQSSVADLSVSVAGRLIGQDLSDIEHRKIIERYLAEAGSLNAN